MYLVHDDGLLICMDTLLYMACAHDTLHVFTNGKYRVLDMVRFNNVEDVKRTAGRTSIGELKNKRGTGDCIMY